MVARGWVKCPQCGLTAQDDDQECRKCGRTLTMTPAEETAWALHQLQEQSKPKRNAAVSGCAQLIAAGLLILIGLALLLFATPIGLLYFGILIVIALVRVLMKH